MKRKPPNNDQSAGVLLFRRACGQLQVLLGHPGGPFWAKKDLGAWTIPKGLLDPDEAPLAAAAREFKEETGHEPLGDFVSLGDAKQPGGKIVHAWTVEDDWDAEQLRSNTFEMEWPPRSGQFQSFPELDRAAWFDIDEARTKILRGQVIFIDRLEDAVLGGDK
jgi:predicted NUDIX family NTP pyrophosphohydrolase